MTTAAVPGPSERALGAGEPVRRLIVWRHGQTTHNAAGIWQGQLDTELSELGRSQAAIASAALTAYDPVVIWSSDLQRAAATAAALARRTGLPVHTDQRLREIDVGRWSGLDGGQVRTAYGPMLDAVTRGEDLRRGETGETVGEVAQRTRAAADDLLARLPAGATSVIATHGVAGRALVAALAGIDQHTAWLHFAGLGNCHWAELVESPHGWRIEQWNARAPQPEAPEKEETS
ncbi:histidine phosphatase family protein [Calidifontibacter sp. DB0510]|uniref:Histidine phosphatase family protein n=1 Tax=Metallococcus carri TaxID=1656884 RepID=A0A967AXH4_9MICO|nr:histidine phosphatase family protein [Metallococcus carri]NHN54247.1 histidine phosphatase family protein [Metallococcus carri]NOP36913.1 histidine phosphatase family protein [Calidifontibacter sp. DB2511S]